MMKLTNRIKIYWNKFKLWIASSFHDNEEYKKHLINKIRKTYIFEYCRFIIDELDKRGYMFVQKDRFSRNQYRLGGIDFGPDVIIDDVHIVEKDLFNKYKHSKVTPKILFQNLTDKKLSTYNFLLKKEYEDDIFIWDEFFDNINRYFRMKAINKGLDTSLEFKNPFSPYDYEKIKGDRLGFLADVEKKRMLFGIQTELIGTINPKGQN